MLDTLNRRIDYVRLSLTDRCNYRCVFCMPKEGVPFVPHANILRYDEMLRLVSIFTALGICHFKVTGGEPFCRKDATSFIEELKHMRGVEDVTITTNGSLVEPHLERLQRAGIGSLTFSIPSLNTATFKRVTGSDNDPARITQVLDRAQAMGIAVKTNTVLLAGTSEEDILPLARRALEQGYTARFIELMPMRSEAAEEGLPKKRVCEMFEKAFGALQPVERKMGNGPAKVYSIKGYPGYVGLIAAMSEKFCASCNRMRLTSQGFLKACLHHDIGVDLRPLLNANASDATLTEAISGAIRAKPKGHSFLFQAPGDSTAPKTSMNAIGG